MVIVLGYILLRLNAVSKLSSAIASLSILYITSGANLPGIWNLLPITLGVIFCLMIFCFISLNDARMALLSAVLASLFYGLLVPFYGLAIMVFLLSKSFNTKESIFKIIVYGAAFVFLVMPVGWVLLTLSPDGGFAEYLARRLFYVSMLNGFIPQFNPFYIIPFPVILLAVFALPFIFKDKKWLFAPLLVGCLYWALYFLIPQRIIIEFERVVFFTSIIITLLAGFGLEKVIVCISLKLKDTRRIIFRYGSIFAVAFFLLLVPFYTNHSNWSKLVLMHSLSKAASLPRAPANNYLTQEDIKLFENISHKKFLSVPWKGTVIGIATNNYPLVVKAGDNLLWF